MAKARKPEKYPTEGGSYIRQPDGKFDQVERTQPAPPPVPSEAEEPAAPAIAEPAADPATPAIPKE